MPDMPWAGPAPPTPHLLAETAGHALALHFLGSSMHPADAVALATGAEERGAWGTRENGLVQQTGLVRRSRMGACRMFQHIQVGRGAGMGHKACQ